MKMLIDFFTPNIKMSLFEQKKTKSLIIVSFIGLVLIIFSILQNLILRTDNFLAGVISGIAILVLLILTLFILKSVKSVRFAGNFFSIAMVVSLAISVIILKENISALFKYVQGFYSFLAFLSIGILFATSRAIIINSIIIIAATTRVYFFALNQMPEQKGLLTAGYINHIISVIIIAIIVYFTQKFVNEAIKRAEDEAVRKEIQNQKLNKAFELIKETSAALINLSHEINKAANSLSSNANQQASGIEEISATMEEMTSSIVENAENTEQTANSIKSSR